VARPERNWIAASSATASGIRSRWELHLGERDRIGGVERDHLHADPGERGEGGILAIDPAGVHESLGHRQHAASEAVDEVAFEQVEGCRVVRVVRVEKPDDDARVENDHSCHSARSSARAPRG
jgi:hypothetical protein